MPTPDTGHDNGSRRAGWDLAGWRWAALAVIGLALASSLSGLGNGFAYDDLHIVLENKRIHDWQGLWRLFGQPYWMIGAARDLYRPLILAWYGGQWAVGGGNPLVFHMVSVFLYAAVCVALLGFLRQLMSPLGAMVGAALFAVHPVHVESVGNIVGQAELMTALAILLGLSTYVRCRRTTGLTTRGMVGLLVAYSVALLCKEHGIVFPALLGVVELALWRGGQRWREGERTTGRILAWSLVAVTAVYLLVRVLVLGDNPTFIHLSLRHLSAADRILVALGLWPEVLRLLVWPARLYADYSPQQVAVHTTLHPVHLVFLGSLVAWTIAVWKAWRRRASLPLLALLWFPLTFALVSNLLFPTGVLIAERTLFLPSVAVVVGVALLVEWLLRSSRVRPVMVGALLLPMLVAGAWRSAARQPDWEDTATLFAALVSDAPTNARGQLTMGQLFMYLANADRAGPYLARAYALQPSYGGVYAGYLQRTGQCERAVRVAEEAVRFDGLNEEAHTTRIACLLELRRFSEARRRGAEGLLFGLSRPTFTRALAVADSLLASADSIDARNVWVREGRPFDRTGAPVIVQLEGPRTSFSSAMFFGGVTAR